MEIIGEKEKEKITGGTKNITDLSKEQCEKLRRAVQDLSEDEQLKIAGGANEIDSAVKKETIEAMNESRGRKFNPAIVIAYGFPFPHAPETITPPTTKKEKNNE